MLDKCWNNKVTFVNPEELVALIPSAIFWKNSDSTFIGCDDRFAQLAGLDSPKEVCGKTDFDLPWGESQAKFYRHDDCDVMEKQKSKLNIEEKIRLCCGTERSILTNKTPLFSHDGQVQGIIGMFYDMTEKISPMVNHSKDKGSILSNTTLIEILTDSFYSLMNKGSLTPKMEHVIALRKKELLQKKQLCRWNSNINWDELQTLATKLRGKYGELLSDRESLCLYYLIRGKSARETGSILHISQRTVEFYIDSLKDKLNCRKKSDIVEMAFEILFETSI